MDKIDRLLDALGHPDRYSEKDIEAMLADPEVREVYNLLAGTKTTLTAIPEPDIDAEWDTFKKAHPAASQRSSLRILNLFTRNIAAGIAIAVASLAAVGAVVGVSVNYAINHKAERASSSEAVVAVSQQSVAEDTATVTVADTSLAVPETILFDNQPLETIVTRIAAYYGCKAEFSAEAPKSLRLFFRWDQALTLDEVVESLNNFEQIHISVKDKTIVID